MRLDFLSMVIDLILSEGRFFSSSSVTSWPSMEIFTSVSEVMEEPPLTVTVAGSDDSLFTLTTVPLRSSREKGISLPLTFNVNFWPNFSSEQGKVAVMVALPSVMSDERALAW